MNKTFTEPFARGNFNLHSTSKESGRAALAITLTLNNLDVPNFLLLIYPRGGGKETGKDHVLWAWQTHLRLIAPQDGSDEAAGRPRPPALLLSSDC